MSGDVYNRFIAGSALCQLSDERMPGVVQSPVHARALTDVGPGGLQGRDGSRRIKSGPSGAAAKLGMPASTLESKIQSLKIDKYRFKTP